MQAQTQTDLYRRRSSSTLLDDRHSTIDVPEDLKSEWNTLQPTPGRETSNRWPIRRTTVTRGHALLTLVLIGALTLIARFSFYHSFLQPPPGPNVWLATAASENHFGQLYRWLCDAISIRDEVPWMKIHVVDIGLSDRHRLLLQRLEDDGFISKFTELDFATVPSFWNTTVAAGEYAWKPWAVKKTTELVKASSKGKGDDYVVWLDAGDSFTQGALEMLLGRAAEQRFMSPRTGGRARHWVHPGQAEYFSRTTKWNMTGWEDIKMCDGSTNAWKVPETDPLLDEWLKCAYERDCIAPAGSSRENHRQDQSALTLLTTYLGYGACGPYGVYEGILRHMEDHPGQGGEDYMSGVCSWEIAAKYKPTRQVKPFTSKTISTTMMEEDM